MKSSGIFCVAALLAPAAVAENWMRLETAPGIALTTDGAAVWAGQYEGNRHQLWVRGENGAWRSLADPARCLADAGGGAMRLEPCSSAAAVREKTLASLQVEPRLAVADTSRRDNVLALYASDFRLTNPPVPGFSGDVGACQAGTTSPAFRDQVLRRTNFYRAMAGIADVTLDDTFNRIAQSAALAQAANVNFRGGVGLSHEPPANWKCFSADALTGSQKSNLAAGNIGWDAVTAYVDEDGELGHRRWVLFPALARIGTGDVPSGPQNVGANAMYVLGPAGDNKTTRDGFVAWPPKGFVPYTLAYGVWSFGLSGADFSKATLTMTDGTGAPVATTNARQLQNGFGDNTYAWVPELRNVMPNGGRLGPRPPSGGPDLAFTVTLSGVQVAGAARDFTYTVTLVDLADPVTDLEYQDRAENSNTPAGSLVGTLRLKDPNPDPDPKVTYTLVTGPGSEDNASFQIDGTDLKALVNIDFLAKSGWRIRVRGDNGRPNGAFEKALVVCPFGHPTVE